MKLRRNRWQRQLKEPFLPPPLAAYKCRPTLWEYALVVGMVLIVLIVVLLCAAIVTWEWRQTNQAGLQLSRSGSPPSLTGEALERPAPGVTELNRVRQRATTPNACAGMHTAGPLMT